MLNAHKYNEKTASISRIDFTILGNKEIKNLSALGKNTTGLQKHEFYDNTEPQKGGLIDQRMGVTSNELECTTCGLGANYCPGHPGHITLAQPVFHLGYFEHIISILKCVCVKCSKLLVYKNENEIIEILKSKKGKNRLNEIKNLAKSVKYCQKVNYGCGNPVPKIKSEKKKTTIEINIVAEYIQNSNESVDPKDKKPIKEILTPMIIYNILKNISDRDCLILGIDPTKSRPEDMIHTEFFVPPNPVRPSVRADFMASTTREDHLTIKLADILKANQRLAKHMESDDKNLLEYFQDHVSYLQYHVAVYYDNESVKLPQSVQKGVVTKSLASRLKGKEGRIRYNLMGKRTDFSGRTVITPDPTLSINELGVPIGIAKNITFPEIVTPNNIDWLTKLVRNGPENYPGANFVIPSSSGTLFEKRQIVLRFRKEKIDLRYGDIVERHTIDGDPLLLNRQPTLHKLSMLGHRSKIIDNPNYCTFRINPNVTTPYNADFDGDEMNIFCPQSIETQIELEEIADLKLQIITPQSSSPIIAMKQDQLLGIWNLTKEYYKLDWKIAMNFLSGLELSNFTNIQKNKQYTGKEIFSHLIPEKINLLKGDISNPKILVKNGILKIGILGDIALGIKKKNSLVQLIWDEYGVETTRNFLDNTTKLATDFNMFHGMTIGVGDLYLGDSIHQELNQLYNCKKIEILHEITELENNPDMMDEQLFEISTSSKLGVIRESASKLIMANTPGTNMFITMIESGAKGGPINFAQMAGCVGQQDFHGGRMKKNYNDRTLPYFFKNDDRAESRGFIERSFMKGLNLPNFIFHHLAAREALIDQTVRTAESGYIQRKLIKATEDMMINYDGTVRNGVGRILQFQYGDSGADTVKQYDYNFKLMEMGNEEIKNNYGMTREELKKTKEWTEKDNKDYVKLIIKIRDKLRSTQIKSSLNYLTLSNSYMLPVNLYRILDNFRNLNNTTNPVCNEPQYIINMIKDILDPLKTRLYCMTEDEMKDKNSIKYKDDQVAKTAFSYALTDIFSPKKCIFQYKLSKQQLEEIKKEIIQSFNKSIVEPGEMVGIIAAQSLGEPVTQMMLNSLDWEQEIMIHDKLTKKDEIIQIGKFIDHLIETNTDEVTYPDDNIEEGMKKIFYLDTIKKNYYIKSVNENGKVSWKHIQAVTKHLPINKDGTHTLIKVITKTGREVIATKGKSFLTQKNNLIVPIRGDEISVGDYVPIMKNYPEIYINKYLDITKYKTNTNTNTNTDTYFKNYNRIELDNDFGFLIGTYLLNGVLSESTIHIEYKNELHSNKIIKFCNKYSLDVDIIKHYLNSDTNSNRNMKYCLTINSEILEKIICNICGKLPNKKYIPTIAFNACEEFTKGLINGYFTSVKDILNIESENKKLLEGISLLLTKFKILTKINTVELESKNKSLKIHKLSIINKNILNFYDDLTSTNNKIIIKNTQNIESDELCDIIPSVKLSSINKTIFNKNELEHFINTSTNNADILIAKSILDYDIFMDEIISIEEVEPSKTYVYDFTVEDTKNFIIYNGLCVRDSFHASGVGGKGGTNIGVDRIKEIFSLSKDPKEPSMEIYFDKEHRYKKDFANKIASYIKFTTIKDLRTKIEIFYEPNSEDFDGFMIKDNVGEPFYSYQSNKQSCSNSIDGLPWLMRIEFDKEKLLNKEVTLLDIKSQFCFAWEKRHQNIKSMKREKKELVEKITQLAVLSNTDNDKIPVIHIKFDMTNFSQSTLVDFMDIFIDEFKLKGIENIQEVRSNGKAVEERIISFDNSDQTLEKKSEYVIYTKGINMIAIKNIIGIDLNRTYCNDIITVYENYGIEAARIFIIRQIITVLTSNASGTNYQHIEIFGDLMTQIGTLTSIDRHGLNKLDNDPLSRASFEKTVDQLITAAVFNEVDYMKSVSSRIMAGLCIKGGTGLCNLILDKELLENSEFTTDIGQLYQKTYKEITSTLETQEINDDIFIPEM